MIILFQCGEMKCSPTVCESGGSSIVPSGGGFAANLAFAWVMTTVRPCLTNEKNARIAPWRYSSPCCVVQGVNVQFLHPVLVKARPPPTIPAHGSAFRALSAAQPSELTRLHRNLGHPASLTPAQHLAAARLWETSVLGPFHQIVNLKLPGTLLQKFLESVQGLTSIGLGLAFAVTDYMTLRI